MFYTTRRRVKRPVQPGAGDPPGARVLAAGLPLLAAAQRTHEVRDGLTLEMIIAVAKIHGDTRYLEPILQSALDGLRHPNDGEPT